MTYWIPMSVLLLAAVTVALGPLAIFSWRAWREEQADERLSAEVRRGLDSLDAGRAGAEHRRLLVGALAREAPAAGAPR